MYHQDLRKEVIKLNRDGINEVAKLSAHEQENTVFHMHGEMGPDMHKPYWRFIVKDVSNHLKTAVFKFGNCFFCVNPSLSYHVCVKKSSSL